MGGARQICHWNPEAQHSGISLRRMQLLLKQENHVIVDVLKDPAGGREYRKIQLIWGAIEDLDSLIYPAWDDLLPVGCIEKLQGTL